MGTALGLNLSLSAPPCMNLNSSRTAGCWEWAVGRSMWERTLAQSEVTRGGDTFPRIHVDGLLSVCN